MSTPTTSPTGSGPELDPHDVSVATAPPPRLEPFNRAGVLAPADVHAARTLCELTDEQRPDVLLAAALAVRAPRFGHVCVDLRTVASTVTGADEAPVAVEDLDWPDPDVWRGAIASSPLVRVRPPGTPADPEPLQDRPLVLVGERLYLDRYWRYERRVAEVLRKRAERTVEGVDPARVRELLDRLLPPGEERPDRQRLAVASGALRALTVIAGGPGTGKTFTLARLLALLHELTDDGRAASEPEAETTSQSVWPRVAVAAPTGKAADRMTAALREAAAEVDTDPQVRQRLLGLQASTIHKLLGWRPGTRFAHHRDNKLPHQVVVVDETSMVDLPLMAKLVSAMRPESRLVLVGDPDQLASVEAGAVLADIVGPTDEELRMSPAARDALAAATGEPLADVVPPRDPGIDDAIVVLGTVRRFAAGSGIARLAAAIHAGDGDAAVAALAADASDCRWIAASGEAGDRPDLASVRDLVVGASREVFEAARRGDAPAALAGLDAVRVLCAHRRGPVGVTGWVPTIERWLAEELDGFDPTQRWYVGRPVLVTQNEPRLHLYNGDVGVVVDDPDTGGVQVAFRGGEGTRTFSPSRLEHVETVHAMTIHKSQGSQFDQVVVVLPDETSPILTRELLYTAVTRAQRGVTVVGTEAAVRHAIDRRVARVSGLRETLWGP